MVRVIEIKTLHEYYLKYLIKNPELVYWNKQLSFYADQCISMYGEDVNAGVLAVCRNTAKLHYFPIQYTDYLDDIEILEFTLQNDILPSTCDEKTCDKCELKKVCKNFDGSLSEFVNAVSDYVTERPVAYA